jgi:hypothetical protein
MSADVLIHGHAGDTVYLVEPLTQAAREWLTENVTTDATWLGQNLAVEHRYIGHLVAGMIEAGLRVE